MCASIDLRDVRRWIRYGNFRRLPEGLYRLLGERFRPWLG